MFSNYKLNQSDIHNNIDENYNNKWLNIKEVSKQYENDFQGLYDFLKKDNPEESLFKLNMRNFNLINIIVTSFVMFAWILTYILLTIFVFPHEEKYWFMEDIGLHFLAILVSLFFGASVENYIQKRSAWQKSIVQKLLSIREWSKISDFKVFVEFQYLEASYKKVKTTNDVILVLEKTRSHLKDFEEYHIFRNQYNNNLSHYMLETYIVLNMIKITNKEEEFLLLNRPLTAYEYNEFTQFYDELIEISHEYFAINSQINTMFIEIFNLNDEEYNTNYSLTGKHDFYRKIKKISLRELSDLNYVLNYGSL